LFQYLGVAQRSLTLCLENAYCRDLWYQSSADGLLLKKVEALTHQQHKLTHYPSINRPLT
jgi:hypothetical protein